jgi:DNA-binding MarR family transcriptional regulator
MDGIGYSNESVAYDRSPPALLFGAGGGPSQSVAAMLGEAGVRLAANEPLGGALERIERQLSHGLIWVECAPGEALERPLLERLQQLAEGGAADVVLSIPSAEIDPALAVVDAPAAQVLVDADDIERGGALALALARRGAGARVSDVGRDNAVRLRQLSDEMGRIAATLARLSTGPEGTAPVAAPAGADVGEAAPPDIETVRQMIRARRLRARFFDETLFADPAWDMLLDLFQAELAQHRVPVSSLCIAAAVPATTALRWIKSMTDCGLFLRRPDPHDGRRVFIELSADASRNLRRYFGEVGAVLAA